MEHELTTGKLLDENGNLKEAGFSYQLVKKYNRNAIKAGKSRIKEWDYYYVGNDEYGVALTVADNSYMSLVSVSVLDFISKKETTKSLIKFFSNGKLNLPSSSKEGDVNYENKNCSFKFLHTENGNRRLIVHYKNFENKKDFRCDIYLEETNKDTMVIATPFKKKKHFYYNQKINLLRGHGYAKVGDKLYDLNNSYGVLDWGRGVWTYRNTWYWSSVNTTFEGKRIGWNLGYGFGDTSAASENMFFYNDRAYKLEHVKFEIPLNEKGNDDYLSPWTFRSNDNKIQVVFTPILDRYSGTNAIIIKSIQHQVFGKFSGSIEIDNGEIVQFDNIIGFAEKVYNCW